MPENTEVLEFEKLIIHIAGQQDLEFEYDDIIEIDPKGDYVYAIKDGKFVQYHNIPFTIIRDDWNDEFKAKFKRIKAEEAAAAAG